jgi:hypothetical protein
VQKFRDSLQKQKESSMLKKRSLFVDDELEEKEER